MVKIQRLKINKFRNVRPGTELRFDARINLVIGDSGSGKTTLLGLLTAIAGSDFSALENEAFDLLYEVSDGIFSAIVEISGGGSPPRSPIDGLPEPITYAYRVGITRGGGGDPMCEIVGTPEALVVRVTGVTDLLHAPPVAPFRRGFLTRALRQPPAAALFFAAWNLFNWNGTSARFDESLGCFLAMTGRGPAIQGVALPRPAEAAFSFDPRSGLRSSTMYAVDHYLPAGAIDRAIVNAHHSAAGEIHLDTDESDGEPPAAALASLGFLRRAAQVLGFRGASFHPDIVSHRHERATGEQHYVVRGFTFRFTRADGTTIHHDLLSYGQKRLVALFYYLAASEQFIIADEIVHGIHQAWIDACVQAIGQRQGFLTSQDPRILAHLGLDSLAQVLARVITCEVVVIDGAEQLHWRNITAEAATAFFQRHARETMLGRLRETQPPRA
jgi:energy-coupling factor transporter ATP-binding protein EcfA2